MLRIEKTKGGMSIEVEGKGVDMLAELTALVKGVKIVLEDKIGLPEGDTKELLTKAINLAFMDDEELERERNRVKKEEGKKKDLLRELLRL